MVCFVDKKQIHWEANRDRWIKGYDKALGKKQNNKRQKQQKTGNKNKKQKK